MNLYPEARHPYYLVCPQYTVKSAGVKAIYLLCHYLNVRGYPAFLITYPEVNLEAVEEITFDLISPALTKPMLKRHLRNGQAPITVYPETVRGNPFSAPCVVRYYLNFPGLLGGGPVSADELNFGYAQVLAEAIDSPSNVLFIPTIDTNVFHPPTANEVRKGTCFYAGKYQEICKGKLFDITKDSLEITRGRDAQTPPEIAQIFRTSELFYAYENTMLISEAILCGCPAVILPNPYMTQSIAKAEFGEYGQAWGASPEQIAYARKTVEQGWPRYGECIKMFHEHLSLFIEKTQKYAERVYA
jgi:hypothetical protein